MIINVSTGFLLVPWLLSLKGTLLLFLNLNLCKILFLHFVFIQHNWHQMNFCTEFYFVLINGEVKGIIVVNRKKNQINRLTTSKACTTGCLFLGFLLSSLWPPALHLEASASHTREFSVPNSTTYFSDSC